MTRASSQEADIQKALQSMGRKKPGRIKVAPRAERTLDNIVFHSKREMQQYSKFKALLNCGAIANLELQKKYTLPAAVPTKDGRYIPRDIAVYVADFVITELNGEVRIYETKGHRTEIYLIKKRWFEASHPDLRIVEI